MKFLIVFLLIFFFVWDAAWWMAGIKPVGPWRLKRMLSDDPGPGVPLLVDVRTDFEYSWFHIAEAKNHPEILAKPELPGLEDKGSPVVVICMSGHRAPLAALSLKRQGFRNVSYLSWGMLGWIATGGPVTRGADSGTR